MKKWLPWIITAVFAIWIASAMRPPKEGAWALHGFGKLPLLANGRLQPMDSLARNSLLQIRNKQHVDLHDEERSMPAIEWLVELMMKPEAADKRLVFRIDHPEVKSLLKLPAEDPNIESLDGKHYSWSQIEPELATFEAQSKRIGDIEAEKRSAFERAIMQLQGKLFLYMRLKNTVHPQDTTNFVAEIQRFQRLVEPGLAAFRAQQTGQEFDEELFEAFTRLLSRYSVMDRFQTPLLVPPHHPEVNEDDWMRMGEALIEVVHGHALHFAVTNYATMATAFRDGDSATFNQAVASYRLALSEDFAPVLTKVSKEQFFNNLAPFYKTTVIYVFAFLLAVVGLLMLGASPRTAETLRRSAFWLVVLACVIHTGGLIFRMALEGRPPVTNLYSSAIFIGWGAVILGLFLERTYPVGIGSLVGSLTGFVTLIIAHNLALGGDTMEMMRAVLDTNFWLATHVVVITLGYASTFLAGVLAIAYVIFGLTTRLLRLRLAKSGVAATGMVESNVHGSPASSRHRAVTGAGGGTELGKALAKMVYAIICFATLFSFVGTVLGGIWADQSWGRFWGWDPKENGALIIVLWNALILHARWGGMIKDRGLMTMAIVGNIVTSWSWFGVNMLGIGLHSYGFMDSAFKWLMLFVVSQLALIALGMLPLRLWTSFRKTAEETEAGGPLPEPAPAGK